MTSPLLEERLVPISTLSVSVRKLLEGGVVLRFVDEKGGSVGLFLSPEAMEDILEDMEFASPAFREEMKESFASGRVSGGAVKRGTKKRP